MSETPDTVGTIFRRTNANKGRHISVTPKNSSMKRLSYGRIILDAGTSQVSFNSDDCEIGLICLSGKATVKVGSETHELSRHDAIYIPRHSAVEVSTTGTVDFAECAVPVDGDYPVQVVRYADVEKDSTLRIKAGSAGCSRTISIMLGKNITAGRILAGIVSSEPGNWTSWPPHEHEVILEELYVYYDMPPPSFGVQFVYTNPDEPEFIGVVRDGDAVLMPRGYHPNVSIPGHSINFVWMMAAHKEVEDRQYGVVNFAPGFEVKK